MKKTDLSERRNYNVSPELLRLLKKAANRANEPLAIFVRKAAIDRAYAVLGNR